MTTTHQKRSKILALSLVLASLIATPAQGESEQCDKFTFAARGSQLPAITMLKTGIMPILSIAGQMYHYDVVHHCFSNMSGSDCQKPQKITSGGKVVAVLEGSPLIQIFSVDARGNANRDGIHYQMAVARDAYRTTQPRFWLEAVNPHDAATGDRKTIGRVDAVDGLTISQMNGVKAKLASGHSLVDLSHSSVMYSNCRKLAVVKFDDRYYPTDQRSPASQTASLAQPPRPQPLQKIAAGASKTLK